MREGGDLLSIDSNGLLNTVRGENKEEKTVMLARVTAISPGLRLQFYGDSSASQKNYKRLGSYTPAVGDTVAVCRVNSSYLVLGKVV